ncbi:MAG TPA: hypothetical protein VHF51_09280 [Solirubrobacteraceae bacterium]|nr:hypothetical protein [Solirubrobacteraceae bacterium]
MDGERPDPDRDRCQQLVVDRRVGADHHRYERGEEPSAETEDGRVDRAQEDARPDAEAPAACPARQPEQRGDRDEGEQEHRAGDGLRDDGLPQAGREVDGLARVERVVDGVVGVGGPLAQHAPVRPTEPVDRVPERRAAARLGGEVPGRVGGVDSGDRCDITEDCHPAARGSSWR